MARQFTERFEEGLKALAEGLKKPKSRPSYGNGLDASKSAVTALASITPSR